MQDQNTVEEKQKTPDEWKEFKEKRKEKRKNNREFSTTLLNKRGVKFESHNNGAHLRVETSQGMIDFWPGTGYWKSANGVKGRGVQNLLKLIPKLK